MKKAKLLFFMICTLVSFSVSAAVFPKSGKITRVVSTPAYGGCLIKLDVAIDNGCSNKGWVSLDCNGDYLETDLAERNYSTAMVAAALGKQVGIYIDNTKTVNTFCVANRIDIIF